MTIQKTVILTSVLGFGLMMAPSALAQPFYLQLDGGASFLNETDLGDGDDGEYDGGYVFGGRLGVIATDGVRFELDLAYAANDFDEVAGVDLGNFGLDADLSILTFGIGAYVDVLPYGVFSPYIGGGFGGAYKEIDANFDVDGDDDDLGLAAHGEFGIGVQLTPIFTLVPHYRLVWLDEVGEDEQFAHWLRLGVRITP